MWPIEPRVRSLTGFQFSRLEEHEDTWAALANSLKESNRNLAESAARRLYAAIGEPMPPVLWVRSPDELRLARLLKLADRRARGGSRPPKAHPWSNDWPLRMLWEPLIRDYLHASGEMSWEAWGPIEAMGMEVAARVEASAMRRFELEIDRATDGMVEAHGWPGQFFGSLATLDFAYRHLLRELSSPRSQALIDLYRHCGACFPEHDSCWLIERPLMMVVNDDHKLHCDTGPAIVYRDGWGAHYLNGCWVPEHVVLRPSEITLEGIAMQLRGEAREEMIRRYGIERYLLDIGAEVVSDDAFGTLYRLQSTAGRFGRQILRVVDATARADGSRNEHFLQVPMSVKTAREAVAWTFTMSAEQYAPSINT